ncbi:MAG: hypothetical protein U9R08_01135 [Nanoarchaeota archaeon]|nr:hypothetical protein [Nanoarchaeota archaeon]
MKKITLVLLIISILVMTACTGPRVICKKPYIRVGTECCLDYNGDSVCDKDEALISETKTNSVGSAIDVLNSDEEENNDSEETELKTETTTNTNIIKIDKAYWNTMYPKAEQEIELTLVFENQGTTDSTEFEYIIKIFKGSKVVEENTFELDKTIEPGYSQKVKDIKYSFSEEGDYTTKIFLKDNENIERSVAFYVSEEEQDEEDNDDDENENNEVLQCTDHDEGRDFTTSSYCEDASGKHFDSCYKEDVLMEYYCDSLVGHTCLHTLEFDCNCNQGKCE